MDFTLYSKLNLILKKKIEGLKKRYCNEDEVAKAKPTTEAIHVINGNTDTTAGFLMTFVDSNNIIGRNSVQHLYLNMSDFPVLLYDHTKQWVTFDSSPGVLEEHQIYMLNYTKNLLTQYGEGTVIHYTESDLETFALKPPTKKRRMNNVLSDGEPPKKKPRAPRKKKVKTEAPVDSLAQCSDELNLSKETDISSLQEV